MSTKKGDWTLVRVRPEWLDTLRAACKENMSPALPFDVASVCDPELVEFACDISGWVTSGEWSKQLRPAMDQAVFDAASLVAEEFDAQIVMNEDGSLSVIKPGYDATVSAVPSPMIH